MARRKTPVVPKDGSLLDVVDSLLNKGVVLQGEVVLGVANVDLIYLKLSALLSALDRAMEGLGTDPALLPRHEQPRRTPAARPKRSTPGRRRA
jgi:hypothetical protein